MKSFVKNARNFPHPNCQSKNVKLILKCHILFTNELNFTDTDKMNRDFVSVLYKTVKNCIVIKYFKVTEQFFLRTNYFVPLSKIVLL